MPARHRHRHSSERGKSLPIAMESCSRSDGIRVLDMLETVNHAPEYAVYSGPEMSGFQRCVGGASTGACQRRGLTRRALRSELLQVSSVFVGTRRESGMEGVAIGVIECMAGAYRCAHFGSPSQILKRRFRPRRVASSSAGITRFGGVMNASRISFGSASFRLGDHAANG